MEVGFEILHIFFKQRFATHHTDGDVYLKPTLKFCNAGYVEEDLICIKVGIYYFLMCSINGTYIFIYTGIYNL